MPPSSPTSVRPPLRALTRAEVQLGASLRRYRLIERIATGSMGVVYRAVDRRLARTVALKLLRTDVSHRTAVQHNIAIARARFLQEARAMAQLAHPNVVPIYAIESVGPHLVIAMEYVPGTTLAHWLGERRSWTDVLAVMRAAGEGLAAAHAAGFVHRDFKPHNVLIGDDGRVRVTDFGLAMLQADDHDTLDERSGPAPDATIEDGVLPIDAEGMFESLTQTGMSVGTPAYMAPEQHAGGVIDVRTDQYGFCAALYEALYGVRPFIGCDAVELMRAKRGMRLIAPLSRREVPRWVERAVLRGLSPDASRRFPSMRALLDALTPAPKRRWLAGVSTGIAAAGFIAGFAMAQSSPAVAAVRADHELARPRVELARASARAPIVRAQRHIAAHEWNEAERILGAAYFAAIADAQLADAAASADLLALVANRTNDAKMAEHWRGHAAAARQRAH